jgi:KDO2-lipid IV(A) lauroyltransferase
LPSAVGQINRAMESLIRQCPSQYLWGYGRYKTPRPEA